MIILPRGARFLAPTGWVRPMPLFKQGHSDPLLDRRADEITCLVSLSSSDTIPVTAAHGDKTLSHSAAQQYTGPTHCPPQQPLSIMPQRNMYASVSFSLKPPASSTHYSFRARPRSSDVGAAGLGHKVPNGPILQSPSLPPGFLKRGQETESDGLE